MAHFDGTELDREVWLGLRRASRDPLPDEPVAAVDGGRGEALPGPPAYELQLMLAVFDFPTWSDGADDELVPEFFIDRISSD